MVQVYYASYILHLENLIKVGLKKKTSKYFLSVCILMDSTKDQQVEGLFIPIDLCLNELGKGPLGNSTYQISSI